MDTVDNNFLSEDMINLYPLQKTLCFELLRIDKTGKISDEFGPLLDETREHFEKNEVVKHEEKKIEDSKEIEDLLNKIHCEIIEESLENLSKDKKFKDYISNYYKLQKDINATHQKISNIKNKKSKKYKKINIDLQDKENRFKQVKNNLFTVVRENFINNDKYDTIFSEERDDLLKAKSPEKEDLISSFDSFNSYFKEYDERLKYIYEDDPKRYDKQFNNIYEENDYKKYIAYKSIPYLLINYNLPIFIKNSEILSEIYNYYIKNKSMVMYISKDERFELSKLSNISKFPAFRVFISKDNKDDEFALVDTILKNKAIRSIDDFSHYITKLGIEDYNKIISQINQEITKYNQRQYENGKRTGKEYIYLSHLGLLKKIFEEVDLENDKKSIFALEQNTDILKKIYDDKELVEIIKKFSNEECLKEFKDVFTDIDKKYDLENLFLKNGDYLMNTLHLNEDKKINKSYIQLSELKNQNVCEKISNKAIELFDRFNELIKKDILKEILEKKYSLNEKNLGRHKDKEKNTNVINSIEKFLDSIKNISEFVSYFMPKKSEDRYLINFDKINFDIYNRINPERLSKIDQIYNHVQAYFSSKNFSTRKIRLNFDKGWDIAHINSYTGTILIKEENGIKTYFLAVINKNNFVKCVKECESDGEAKYISQESIKAMVEGDELYLFQINNKHLSKKFNKNKNFHTIYWENIFDKDNIGKNIFTNNGKFYVVPPVIKSEEQIFSINGEAEIFYRPQSLSEEDTVIHPANEPIANKNKNNPKKTSKFEIDLIKDKRYTKKKLMINIPIIINCNSQVKKIQDILHFLRDQHQHLDQDTLNKNIQSLQQYLNEQHVDQDTLSKNIQSLQQYLNEQHIDQDTLNKKIQSFQYLLKKQSQSNLNKKILEKIRKSEDINIIGISRSRDDLLCANVIDFDGKIVNKEPISLSTIYSKKHYYKLGETKSFEQDYNALINEKRQEKNNAQDKDDNLTVWKTERSIKDFLTGYTSQVVNKIVNLINKDKNSIIVFEEAKSKNLKDSKIEESLYRDLIKAIISKLSYLSYKDKTNIDLGSTFKGFQLTYYEKEDEKEYNKLEKQKKDKAKNKNGKNEKKSYDENIIQNGIVFHNIPTKLTSDIDTDTCFMNCFDFKDNISIKDFKEFIQKFDITLHLEKEIYKPKVYRPENEDKEYLFYDEEKILVENVYAFEFKYDNVIIKKINKKNEEIKSYKFLCEDIVKNIKKGFLGKAWTLYSCVDRVEEKDGKFIGINLSNEFRNLFREYIPNTIIKEISNEIVEEFSNYIHSYKDFDIEVDETDTNKREFLINLRNSDSFETDFNKIGNIDKNEKVLEILKKHHILNIKILDTIERDYKELLKNEKEILYDITNKAIDILKKYKNDFIKIKHLQNDIVEFLEDDEERGKIFCKEFLRLFKLMLQMRNYDDDNDFEYVLSPVGIDKNGALRFFHSSLDENSSKNIAKKGLILVNKIRNPKGDLDKLDLKVTDQEWISSVIGDKFKK